MIACRDQVHWSVNHLIKSLYRFLGSWNGDATIEELCNRNLSNCKVATPTPPPKKKILRTSTGFKPVASAFTLQCSTSWAMKTHTLRAGQFHIEFINPWKGRNTEWNDVNPFVLLHFTSFHSVLFLSWVDELSMKLAWSPCMGLHSSAGRALQHEHRGHRFQSCWSPGIFFRAASQLLKLLLQLRWSHLHFILFPQFTPFHTMWDPVGWYQNLEKKANWFETPTCHAHSAAQWAYQ